MAKTYLDFGAPGPVTTVLLGAAAAVLTAFACTVWHIGAWWPLLLSLAAGAGQWWYCHLRRAVAGNTIYRVGCVVAAGMWTASTVWLGWTLGGGVTLAALVLPAVAVASHLWPIQERPAGQPTILTQVARPALSMEWEELVTRLCGFKRRVHVGGIDYWPEKTGYTVHIEFPKGSGYTWERLKGQELEFASAINNLAGCPVKAFAGERQNTAMLKVTLKPALTRDEPLLYPRDYSPLTITKPLGLGILQDLAAALVNIRQQTAICAGRRGGGKTNILDLFTANGLRCTDALVLHGDLNGGGMSVPWLLPYVTGLTNRPAIDWVATTAEELVLMTRVLLAIAKDRKARYGALKARHNTRLLPVSADLPAIVLILDEGAEALGDGRSEAAQEASANIQEIVRIGRAEGVNVVFSSLRATGDHIPVQLRTNSAVRIGTQVEEDDELAYLFDWGKNLRSADLPEPGMAYLQSAEDYGRAIHRMTAYYLLPEQIAEIVLATTARRPELDEIGQRVGGEIYAQRWGRAQAFLDAIRDPGQGPVAAAPSSPSASMDGAFGEHLAGIATRLATTIDEADGATPLNDALRLSEDEITRQVEAIAQLDPVDPRAVPAPAVPAPRVPEPPSDVASRREVMRRIIEDAGPNGIRTGDVFAAVRAAGINVGDSTLHDWLKNEKVDGHIVLWQGKQGRWVTPGNAEK